MNYKLIASPLITLLFSVVFSAQANAQFVDLVALDVELAINSDPVQFFTSTIKAKVKNRGTIKSAPVTVQFFYSINEFISTSDTLLATDTLRFGVEAKRDVTLNANVEFAVAGGGFIGVCVSSIPADTPTTNNCSPATPINVRLAEADLKIRSTAVSDTSLGPDQPIDITAIVKNIGTLSTVGNLFLTFYVSNNNTITTMDTSLKTVQIPSLLIGSESETKISTTLNSSPGQFFLGACVTSPSSTDSNESNNCTSQFDSIQVDVFPFRPDEFESDDTVETAKSISQNSIQTRNLHVAGDIDYATFEVSSQITDVVIETDGESPGDTILELYSQLDDDSIIEIAENDDISNSNRFSRIELPSLEAGKYILKVREFDPRRELSSYTIKLSYKGDDDDFDILSILPAIISGANKRRE